MGSRERLLKKIQSRDERETRNLRVFQDGVNEAVGDISAASRDCYTAKSALNIAVGLITTHHINTINKIEETLKEFFFKTRNISRAIDNTRDFQNNKLLSAQSKIQEVTDEVKNNLTIHEKLESLDTSCKIEIARQSFKLLESLELSQSTVEEKITDSVSKLFVNTTITIGDTAKFANFFRGWFTQEDGQFMKVCKEAIEIYKNTKETPKNTDATSEEYQKSITTAYKDHPLSSCLCVSKRFSDTQLYEEMCNIQKFSFRNGKTRTIAEDEFFKDMGGSSCSCELMEVYRPELENNNFDLVFPNTPLLGEHEV